MFAELDLAIITQLHNILVLKEIESHINFWIYLYISLCKAHLWRDPKNGIQSAI